jgi:hypothetical protein
MGNRQHNRALELFADDELQLCVSRFFFQSLFRTKQNKTLTRLWDSLLRDSRVVILAATRVSSVISERPECAGGDSAASGFAEVALVDGMVTQVSIDCLRQRISLVPQEACLFEGTLRENLDPFSSLREPPRGYRA